MEIQVKNLNYAYQKTNVLDQVSFEIDKGSFLVVIGHNGSGKSTLIKCLLGINKVPPGKIFINSVDINIYKNFNKIGYVDQNFRNFNYDFPITVRELLMSTKFKKISDEELIQHLEQVGIKHLINENINNLSGGQLQRVFICRALMNHPELLILDEPTVGIDRENIRILYETLKNLHEQGITIIVVTHDMSHLDQVATHVLSLDNKVLYFGDYYHFNHRLCEDCR